MKKIIVNEVDKEFKNNVVPDAAYSGFTNAILECNNWTSEEEEFIRHFSAQLYNTRTEEDWAWFTKYVKFPKDTTRCLLGMAMTYAFGGYEAIEMDIIAPNTYGHDEETLGIALGALGKKLDKERECYFYSFTVSLRSLLQSILTEGEYELFCNTGNKHGFADYINSLKTDGKDRKLREIAQKVIDGVVAYKLRHDTNSLYLNNDRYIGFLHNIAQKSTIYKEK